MNIEWILPTPNVGSSARANSKRGACCNHMKFGQVFFEKAQGHDSLGTLLYLIHKEERLAFFYP